MFRGSPFGITRLAEGWRRVTPRDGFFYSTLTRIMDLFLLTNVFIYLFVYSFIEKKKFSEVPEYAKMQFHMIT